VGDSDGVGVVVGVGVGVADGDAVLVVGPALSGDPPSSPPARATHASPITPSTQAAATRARVHPGRTYALRLGVLR
jgi:hypothetical protein